MPRLAIPAQGLGRAPVFELPLRLPEQFDLVLQVWGDPALLARARVAGHRLAATASSSEPPSEPETWHLVQLKRGVTTMLPTEDAAVVGAELARRFGLPYWSFALTATDANRWAIRLLRAVSGRPRRFASANIKTLGPSENALFTKLDI